MRFGVGGIGADSVVGLYDTLAALEGGGDRRPLLMAADGAEFAACRDRISAPLDDVDVVIRTSGSTDGRGRLVGLSMRALTASARATLARLGGPGAWLTSLPVQGVAGFQVVLRSVLAGVRPVVFAPERGFDADLFARRVAELPTGMPRYLSLVPTQLVRALDAAPRALAAFDAVLVGGAALAADVRTRAAEAGVRVVRTYGMTETSGGCVYDGTPLDGVSVRVVDGRVQLAGPTLATRYLDDGPPLPVWESAAPDDRSGGDDATRGCVRWLVTPDVGAWNGDRLTVLGRADDVIISGGVNVHPAPIESALSVLGGTWVVVGVPDAEWGERLVALTDLAVPPSLDAVRAATAHLAPAARPKEVARVDAWPVRPTGKIDRREVAARWGSAGRRR